MSGGVSAVMELPFDLSVLKELESSAREENRACHSKVVAAASLWSACLAADVAHGVPERRAGNAAFAEIAVRLTMSKTMAEKYAVIGCQLRDDLPSVARLFALGDLDFAAVRTIVGEMVSLSETTRAAILPGVLEAASTMSPGPLRSEIDRLLALADPEAHAERHRDAGAQVEVSLKPDISGLVTVRAHTTPEVGVGLMERLRQIAGTVCAKDGRGHQHRMHDAIAALTAGESLLVCQCPNEECQAKKRPAPLAASTLVRVGFDAATLLGLTSEPAYLEGYGVLPADLARVLAEDATWQAMLTEVTNLLGQQPRSTGTRDWSDEEWPLTEWADTDDRRDGYWPDEDWPDEVQPPLARRVLARGRRRPSGHVPTARQHEPTAPRTPASMARAIELALANHTAPEQFRGDPHAFVYRPCAELEDRVRARDGHCRFPNCLMPAVRCQLDHVVPFDHDDPTRGGPTTVDNLHCLCAFHHNLKTLGYWTPLLLPGGVVAWTSLSGLRHVTVPANLLEPPRGPTRRGGRRTTPPLGNGEGECPY